MKRSSSSTAGTHTPHTPWPQVRLGDLGTWVRGIGIRRNDTVSEGLPCLRYGEIYTSYTFAFDTAKSFVSRAVYSQCPHIKNGDVVFTLTGESREEIAKALAYVGKEEVAAGGDLAIWSGHGCDPKYLAYLMYSPQMIKAKADASNGHIIVHASVKKLKEISIPLPPLDEQRAIVARLEKELDEADRLAAAFQRMVVLAEESFRSELEEAFREISHAENAENAEASNSSAPSALSAREKEISHGGPMTRRLEEVCVFMTSGSRGWAKYYSPDGELFITIKNVKGGKVSTDNVQHVHPPVGAETERTRVRKGDLLISITADLGRTGVVEESVSKVGAYINQHLVCVRLDQTKVNPYWVSAYIESGGGQRQIQARNKVAVKAGLNFASIRSIELPIVSLTIQNAIVARLDAARVRADALKAAAERGVALAAELRRSVLAEAFR